MSKRKGSANPKNVGLDFESTHGRVLDKLIDLSLDGACDEEFGNANEAPGRWWGLLTRTGIRGASSAILTVDSQGFYEYEAFPTAAKAKSHFARIVRDVADEMGPEEGDWVTEDHLVFHELGTRKVVAVIIEKGASERSMWRGLDREMKRQGYYPSVWFLSDHGNYHLLERPARGGKR